ncbi:Delta-like protein 1,Fibropellin-3,Protein crumbs homolog 2,Slit homolog 1 protein,Protein crumbs homolog 1,Neurogenic locus Notch protein,Neurogenic locus notch homolog protein 3,Protocadherin Fat 4,Sushi, von Willebrand factor type A, EGF and pentraxin domain-containing protein 1,Fibropellin-1,Neurogenic locus notch homolog protein 2,Protein crumbs,Neurogenic locus notch homolog protein 1 [Mytilus coruscus]|uniref:EGF-like domain-containing protein n=1 Tax=Mytilus coruscus TaxID=42192 RepID=A0A6J8EMW1_MYTCO|nr:Delta-like protein 1,Fibropellin-3,Protein crumbs homolog 2,Slit homolog 1 protein,Protein crumbs homolog 1,Neurogenic locus Notch protein,Neurogenic locus notch homolog protein 3,Protocadherin Fat 4,Sushi, von Willebrand factor type A, EGF and pentraxin domain-containing protein 1,Fibropellin-1,Neurogenic locus notch homolog protein 2,Protein crumbs,Neurogenic locus notch homolog protein 1 [Mytilus coruscus]
MNDFNCNCKSGFTGKRCDTDIDECRSRPCSNGGTCIDRVNRYICHCRTGYTGQICEKDIDDCVNHPCKHGGTCIDHVNGFSCQCSQGYRGFLCEKGINLCQLQPCKNNGKCTAKGHTYHCSCTNGWTGVNCETKVIKDQNCYETDYADCSCMLSRDPSKKVLIANVINKRSIISCLVGTLIGLLSSLGGYFMFLKFCSGMVSSWTPPKWPKRIIPSDYPTRWPRYPDKHITPVERHGPTNIYRASNESYEFDRRDYTNKHDW